MAEKGLLIQGLEFTPSGIVSLIYILFKNNKLLT